MEKRRLPDYQRVKAVLRKLSLEVSLRHIWHFSQYISGGAPLSDRYRASQWRRFREYVFPHEIELLARELILHADRSGGRSKETLDEWTTATNTFNAIKRFANESYDPDADGGVWRTLHQIAHQQLPRFSKFNKEKIGRYLALCRSPALRAIFERQLGIAVETYFVLAFGVIAGFHRSAHLNTATDFSVLNIDPASSEKFFSRITGSLEEMRKKAIESQRLDSAWEYAFNPFHFKPLIALDPKHPERVCCPVPPILERRLLDGVFYDLVGRAKDLPNAVGSAVDEVFGRILSELKPRYEVFKPEPKSEGRERYDGADWVVRKDGHTAFVECKTKRMSLAARVAGSLDDVDSELGVLADAIVQNYANIQRELGSEQKDGHAASKFYNVVMTWEDWFLFSEINFQMLHKNVITRLADKGLPESLLDAVPYQVLSFEAAQYWVAALNSSNMEQVFEMPDDGRSIGWTYLSHLQTKFPDVDARSVGGFSTDFDSVFEPLVESLDRPDSDCDA